VKIRGKSFRFISTHLDVVCLQFTSAIQQAQAAELLGGPAATDLSVVLVGDLNSPGDGTGVTYNNLITAGFADAVVEAGVGGTLTCCQAEDLLNPVSILDRRSEFVLFRGAFTVLGAAVDGDDPADRTPSGLWPSDHARGCVEAQASTSLGWANRIAREFLVGFSLHDNIGQARRLTVAAVAPQVACISGPDRQQSRSFLQILAKGQHSIW
jgi:hypothetical protein